MAFLKSVLPLMSQAAVLAVLVVALGAEAQSSCTSELSNLNICAAFVVPGANNTTPSADCCGALQAVDHDCFCNTMRIASRLPSQCQLSPINCDAN